MSDKKLKQVLVAHPVKFAAEAIKSFLEMNNVNCYILDDLTDFRYLLEDLSPELLLIHESSFSIDESLFLSQTKDFNAIKKVIIRKSGSVNEFDCFDTYLDEPYEIAKISEILERLLD